jgi:peptidoglycan/LPS O-acetylase OafA/YrhL
MSVALDASYVPAVGAPPSASAVAVGARQGSRLPLVDAVRALAATVIVGHHFSSYQPLADAASPIAGPLIDWLREYGRVAQVFIVLSGFMLAGSLAHRQWDGVRAWRFIVQRYCRLALPYFAAIGFAIVAGEFGRDWIDNDVAGALPTIQQVLAHSVFLQDVLGYESLSAGLWFVCITFQLTLLYVAGLYIRDAVVQRSPAWASVGMNRLPMALGWLLAVASLFYFNRDSSWESWAAFFFGQFFLGVLVQRALADRRAEKSLAIYAVIVAIAIAMEWRPRLVLALATGIILFCGGKIGALSRWPTSRAVAFMGRTSYSLFLIHFPVLVVVATLWERQQWTTPLGAVAGLMFAYVVSIAVATLFYRFVEEPAMRLGRRFAKA